MNLNCEFEFFACNEFKYEFEFKNFFLYEYEFEFVKNFCTEFEFEHKVSKVDQFIQPYS